MSSSSVAVLPSEVVIAMPSWACTNEAISGSAQCGADRPIDRRPRRRPRNAFTESSNSSSRLMISRARTNRSRPASVSATVGLRRISSTPQASSRPASWIDTLGCDTPIASAARDTLPASATATKVRSADSVMPPSRRPGEVGWRSVNAVARVIRLSRPLYSVSMS